MTIDLSELKETKNKPEITRDREHQNNQINKNVTSH